MPHEKFQECISICEDCSTSCSHCAASCLRENEVHHLTACIQADVECALVCRDAAALMSMGSPFSKQFCLLCAEVCDACAMECEKHVSMGHCKECAEMCRRCAAECRKMATAA